MAVDYGLQYDTQQVISGSVYLFASGTLADSSTAISASTNQIIAITCSANYNNRLTKLTSMNANATITITSGSSNIANLQNDTTLILRYYSGSGAPTSLIPSSSTSTINHLLGGIGTNITYVDIPLLNNDDSFQVAYKTVRALTASVGYNRTFGAALVDDGSTFQVSSSLGENMKIGTSFEVRNAPTYILPNDYLLSSSGFFTITSLNSGSVATPDFSGTEVQVGGMQLGTSFMIGGGSGSQAFAYNLIQTGSGFLNQPFFQGYMVSSSASIGMRLDPNDNTSGLITGSGAAQIYMSSSGRVGIGTNDPTSDVDIKGDEIRFRKISEDVGIKMNDEGNLESFTNIAGKSATGSELILNYTRGTTIVPIKPNINDIMGSLRWVSDFDNTLKRKGSEVSSITTKVSSADVTGVSGDMIFSVAQTKGAPPTEMMRIGSNGIIMITGSLFITGAVTSSIVSSSILHIQHITASENISASGDLFMKGNITGSIVSASTLIGKIEGGLF
jgi:hypothetical protein